MGLDISAFRKVGPATTDHDFSEGDWCQRIGHYQMLREPDFADQMEGLEPGKCYEAVGHPGAAEGGGWPFGYESGNAIYGADSYGFRAGSYGGYGEWREQLCRLALGVDIEVVWKHPGEFRGKPFFYLLNFADNEGTIGPIISARLAWDFQTQAERLAEELPRPGMAGDLSEDEFSDGAWFWARYDDWARAFALAAGTGMVEFH